MLKPNDKIIFVILLTSFIFKVSTIRNPGMNVKKTSPNICRTILISNITTIFVNKLNINNNTIVVRWLKFILITP